MEDIRLNNKVVMRKVGELHTHEGAHNTDSVIALLKESIQKYGFQQPIVIDKEGNIASGNGIYRAAVELGYDEVPCISIEYLSDEEVAQYRIADNKTAEFARWNQAKLEKEVSYLQRPEELQFCFDEDLTKMLETNQVKFEPAVQRAVQNNVDAVGNVNTPKHNENAGKSNFRDDIEKQMEAKPVEYFEYVCSACGKKVTVKL